jgi:ABC-2 type transport system ATP-binding protein
MSRGSWAIEVDDLRKAYGSHEAVRGLSFRVRRGEVFGLLGPNGAGKTTTVEILEGFRARLERRRAGPGPRPRHPAGRAPRALGHRPAELRLYPHLTPREAVEHWAGLYPAPRDPGEVLELAACKRRRTAAPGRFPAASSGGWTSRSR